MPNFRISFVAMKALVSKQTEVLPLWESETNLVANGSMKVKLPHNKLLKSFVISLR